VKRAEKHALSHSLRVLGRIAADENRTHRIVAGDAGWVWSVHGGTTGSSVSKDELIATIYNYQFLTRQQQFLYSLSFEDRRRKSEADHVSAPSPEAHPPDGRRPSWEQRKSDQYAVPEGAYTMIPTTPGGGMNPAGTAVYSIRDQLEVARLELYSLGVGDYQIKEIERTRRLATDLEIRSPVRGIVLSRNVSPQQRFDKGAELYRIADLSRVWVLADVFEREAPYVQAGTAAQVLLRQQGKRFEAVVSDVPPVFDPVTRAFKVRLDVDNPDLTLRPDMFVDVELLIHFPPAVTVPADALMDTGRTQMVYVGAGDGYFEPRHVRTGRQLGGQVEILEGLMPGEHVVVSGNFLVDSESRMKLASAGIHGPPAKDPVCGMPVSTGRAGSAGLTSEHDGKPYFFCSPVCKKAFDENARHDIGKDPGKHPVDGEATGESTGRASSPHGEGGHADHSCPAPAAPHGEHRP
jgi:multidrug efflux pump subunit AcrA (membrane-fusion protein)/YHS domain-containing protein